MANTADEASTATQSQMQLMEDTAGLETQPPSESRVVGVVGWRIEGWDWEEWDSAKTDRRGHESSTVDDAKQWSSPRVAPLWVYLALIYRYARSAVRYPRAIDSG